MFFWILAPCRLDGKSQRFGETVPIFRAAARFSETLTSTDESTRRQNPVEHHHQRDPCFDPLHTELLFRKTKYYRLYVHTV
jgi:hypothetical protein